jgi:hypothetical protein
LVQTFFERSFAIDRLREGPLAGCRLRRLALRQSTDLLDALTTRSLASPRSLVSLADKHPHRLDALFENSHLGQ